MDSRGTAGSDLPFSMTMPTPFPALAGSSTSKNLPSPTINPTFSRGLSVATTTSTGARPNCGRDDSPPRQGIAVAAAQIGTSAVNLSKIVGVRLRNARWGALFVIAVPGHEYLAKLTLGHTGPL